MRILGIVVCIVAALFFIVAGSLATTAENQSLDNQSLQNQVADLKASNEGASSRIYLNTTNRSDEQFVIWRNTFYALAVGFLVMTAVFGVGQFMLLDQQFKTEQQTAKQAKEATTTPEPPA